LLKDKVLMRSMKEALLQCSEEDLDREEEEKSAWSGKTIFELLRAQNVENGGTDVGDVTDAEKVSPSPGDVIVGRCLLELDELPTLVQVGSKEETSKNDDGGQISSILGDASTSSLRAMERVDSGEEEQALDVAPAEEVRERNLNGELSLPESRVAPPTAGGDSQAGVASAPSATSCKSVSGGGETRLGTSLSIAHTLIQHPAILAACYCLACLHQLTGLDFVTSLGILMAMISMVAMFFF
jgi:hypothetical protein